MNDRTYHIVSRFFIAERGWQREVIEVTGSYEQAGREASRIARVIDDIYGDSHFWTVDCVNPTTDGSYFQLFHGRLS